MQTVGHHRETADLRGIVDHSEVESTEARDDDGGKDSTSSRAWEAAEGLPLLARYLSRESASGDSSIPFAPSIVTALLAIE